MIDPASATAIANDTTIPLIVLTYSVVQLVTKIVERRPFTKFKAKQGRPSAKS